MEYKSEEDSDLIQILCDLKVIATIKENDKVITKNGVHIHNRGSFFSGLWRYVNGENRGANISSMQSIFMKALSYRSRSKRIDDALLQALKGFSRLATTYSEDSSVRARISVIHDYIIDEMETPKNSLKKKKNSYHHHGKTQSTSEKEKKDCKTERSDKEGRKET